MEIFAFSSKYLHKRTNAIINLLMFWYIEYRRDGAYCITKNYYRKQIILSINFLTTSGRNFRRQGKLIPRVKNVKNVKCKP